jgi:hypothetical protein
VKARRAIDALVAEGLTLPQIAGIGHCSTNSVRLFLTGCKIPEEAGQRFCIAARTLRVLGMVPLPEQATLADLVARHCR